MRILMVEDDKELCVALSICFQAAGRIRPEKRATCCKGQADRGTERKVGGGQLGVGDATADCGSGPGSPCWDDASAASFRQGRSRTYKPHQAS